MSIFFGNRPLCKGFPMMNKEKYVKETTQKIYEELFERYPQLSSQKENILRAFDIIRTTYQNDGKLLVGGNGGGSSDSEHIVGELLKSFKKNRAIDGEVKEKLLAMGEEGDYLVSRLEGALPAVSLISQTGILTAFSNDKSWDTALAQQAYGLGKEGDCLILLSTSGNSQNCVYAALVAQTKGIKTLAFTGAKHGKLKAVCDVTLQAPETETYKVQELHLPIYHCLCAMIEEELF